MIIYQPIKSSVTPPLGDSPVFTLNGEEWWLCSISFGDYSNLKELAADRFPSPKNHRNKKGEAEVKKLREAWIKGFKFLFESLQQSGERYKEPVQFVEVG
jgi:hypothetical protein